MFQQAAMSPIRRKSVQLQYQRLLPYAQDTDPERPALPLSRDQFPDFYTYVDALMENIRKKQERARQEILEHTERIRQTNAQTQSRVTRMLSHDTERALPLLALPSKSQERCYQTNAITEEGLVISALDYAINRYIQEMHALPTHIRLSSYNSLMFSLEHRGQTPTSHHNTYGAFWLIADVHLDDRTIVCEEYR